MPAPVTVFIVDSDESVRHAMARLMTASGFRAVCMGSIDALLREDLPASEAVLLVDARTGRQFGGSFHEQLHARRLTLPVIYLTDCDTEPARREAKRVGAAGYFRKPIDEHALFDAISFAVHRSLSQESGERLGVS